MNEPRKALPARDPRSAHPAHVLAAGVELGLWCERYGFELAYGYDDVLALRPKKDPPAVPPGAAPPSGSERCRGRGGACSCLLITARERARGVCNPCWRGRAPDDADGTRGGA